MFKLKSIIIAHKKKQDMHGKEKAGQQKIFNWKLGLSRKLETGQLESSYFELWDR